MQSCIQIADEKEQERCSLRRLSGNWIIQQAWMANAWRKFEERLPVFSPAPGGHFVSWEKADWLP
jgi:hypothetical protein